jgi:protein-S-isoprenylcysteine O-methyltransferase Ste14
MLVSYQVIEFIILFTFLFFISDIRNKKGMKSLVGEKRTLFMKIVYLFSAGAYIYVLATLDRLLVFDIAAFILTLSGTLLTMKAKLDLADSHTWTGYGMENRHLVTSGIYQYLRHPLYTGIFVFIIGGLAIILPRLPWFLSFIVIAVVVYLLYFIIRSARLETRLLLDTFGKEFTDYQRQVHPFLPLRKYSGNR